MAQEPDNMVLVILREIRAKQDEHSDRLGRVEARLQQMDRRLEDMSKVVTYSLGESTRVALRQSEQDSRIDELFEKLEKLLADKEPV